MKHAIFNKMYLISLISQENIMVSLKKKKVYLNSIVQRWTKTETQKPWSYVISTMEILTVSSSLTGLHVKNHIGF